MSRSVDRYAPQYRMKNVIMIVTSKVLDFGDVRSQWLRMWISGDIAIDLAPQK